MNENKNILVIDDDPGFRIMLETFLKKNHFNTFSVGSAIETLKILKKELFDLILIDLRLPDKDGIDLMKEIKEGNPGVPLILMTSFVDIKTAVKAIKSGAFEYITKPLNTDELMSAIDTALKNSDTPAVTTLEKNFQYEIGESERSKEIVQNIKLVAPTNLSVVITGESGTGKEYVARLIHAESKRADRPFIAVDCGVLSSELAVSELFGHVKGAFTGATFDKAGHFENANNGTIFLDEIGNLSPDIQVALLRALQEKQIRRIGSHKMIPVDVRIIVATNEDLQTAIAKGSFREDLYHRLNEFSISVSPLRKRAEDILKFAYLFLQQANVEMDRAVKGFDRETESTLLSYNWPGNLRELKNVVKRSVLHANDHPVITKNMLPADWRKDESLAEGDLYDLKVANMKQEKEYILKVLEKVKYNKSSAARILNIDRKTLYNKLKQFGLDL